MKIAYAKGLKTVKCFSLTFKSVVNKLFLTDRRFVPELTTQIKTIPLSYVGQLFLACGIIRDFYQATAK